MFFFASVIEAFLTWFIASLAVLFIPRGWDIGIVGELSVDLLLISILFGVWGCNYLSKWVRPELPLFSYNKLIAFPLSVALTLLIVFSLSHLLGTSDDSWLLLLAGLPLIIFIEGLIETKLETRQDNPEDLVAASVSGVTKVVFYTVLLSFTLLLLYGRLRQFQMIEGVPALDPLALLLMNGFGDWFLENV